MKGRRTFAWLSLAIALQSIAACGTPPRRPSFGESLEDATITVGVKTALLNDPGIGVLKIDVHTSQGVVTLAGTVKSRDEEAAAIALARNVQGVRDVKSELKIVP